MDGPAYSFGPFVLDAADRRLLREGQPVEVTARYFDALLLLVGENGRLVSKDRFHTEVWNGIPVTDEALTQCIRTLRKALDDDAGKPQYIETVPRHGYRFVAPVAAAGEPGTRQQVTPRLLRDTAAAALGGGLAGVVGALTYLALGLVVPGIGAASTLLVLMSVNLLLGLIAGAAVGAGISLVGKGGVSTIAGGALGGLLVGAIGHMVGNDLFQLFFGRAPGEFTGAFEGLLLGGASGTGIWFAERHPNSSPLRRVVLGPLAGGFAGFLIAIGGGRLMVGSLAALAQRFPESRLRLEALDSSWLGAATITDGALFAGGLTLAIAVGRGMRVRRESAG